MIARALTEGLVIIVCGLIYTAAFVVMIGPHIVPGGKGKIVGPAAVCGATLESPYYWLPLVAVIAGVVWLFKR